MRRFGSPYEELELIEKGAAHIEDRRKTTGNLPANIMRPYGRRNANIRYGAHRPDKTIASLKAHPVTPMGPDSIGTETPHSTLGFKPPSSEHVHDALVQAKPAPVTPSKKKDKFEGMSPWSRSSVPTPH